MQTDSARITPIVLAGGSGTRLWPMSRSSRPKQFLNLVDDHSLFQDTLLRLAGDPRYGEPIVVTNQDYRFLVAEQAQELGLRLAGIILEPVARNTAPAIVAAALFASREQTDRVLHILPSDHRIVVDAAYTAALDAAETAARNGMLVTFGIAPTEPATGFGYIEAGEMLDQEGAARVRRFVEKPLLEVAEQYLSSGNFLWNSGMFCFSAGTLLAELQQYAPELLERVAQCVQASPAQDVGVISQRELDRELFADLPDISIDYALMELSAKVAVVPASFDWSDIGSWGALSGLVTPDAQNNRAAGEAIFIDSNNTFVQSEGRLVAAVGVQDLIVVDTADAILVAHAERAQDVRQVVKRLKDSGHDAYRLHRTVSRPWGTYTVLEEGPRFKIKRIVVKPGAALSLQMHHHRSEHWVVVQGMAQVTNGENVSLVNSNESTYIPAGHRHRLVNPGVIDLVMIEVQSGEYLGEDDIVRFEDQYGRAP